MLHAVTKPDDALERADAAFAAGDHKQLRAELDALPAEARTSTRARQLDNATTFDPVHAALLVACAVVLTGVALYYL
jgi:hypothetical protein